MRNLKNNRGMTMAEVLIVIGILAVLFGVTFVSVNQYRRSVGQFERDAIAKEIFVAAQNHLAMARSEGYAGSSFGNVEADDVYYFDVNGGTSSSGSDALSAMLPFGSIDETVRTDGSYIIRYQKSTGRVLDVFYCSAKGQPEIFNHNLSSGEYNTVMSLRDTAGSDKKSARRTFEGNSILGWYGGTSPESLTTIQLDPPRIEVINAEKLSVKITNTNMGKSGAAIRLFVEGKESGTTHYLQIESGVSEVVLDDISTKNSAGSNVTGGHFAERFFSDMKSSDTSNGFIPGEDISIQAVAYSTSAFANVAYSAKQTTNSLFASVKGKTAKIENFRHFENLGKSISGVNRGDGVLAEGSTIRKAVQTKDLVWTDFLDVLKCKNVYALNDSTGTKDNCFLPVDLDYELTYDGNGHDVKKLKVDSTGEAGLFGKADKGLTASNLRLVGFSIKGGTSTGALAGSLKKSNIQNVVSIEYAQKTDPVSADIGILSGGNAGGLIGSMEDTKVLYCASDLLVNGGAYAGGLVADASGSSEIKGCYSGGHTEKGEYYKHDAGGKRTEAIYNVKASGMAGGLVGSFSGTKIENSYSTCSASGVAAAGLCAQASGSISNCYCTGLVSVASGQEPTPFVGAGSPSLSGNYYYSIINDKPSGVLPESEEQAAPEISEDELSAIDASVDTYDNFMKDVSDGVNAYPRDEELVALYDDKFGLKGISQLEGASFDETKEDYFVAGHYGDWPAPEILVVNTK